MNITQNVNDYCVEITEKHRAKSGKFIWEIDVPHYNRENIKVLIDFADQLRKKLEFKDSERKATDTLVTKIMLGVYGNIPAFDSLFKKGIVVSQVNDRSLRSIYTLYNDNEKELLELVEKSNTLDFITGEKTKRKYTVAKIIDMAGFIEGRNKQNEKSI